MLDQTVVREFSFTLLMTSRWDRNAAEHERNWFMCLIDGSCAARTRASI